MDYAKGFGKGVLSEGLWEENIQTSVNQYEERLAKGYQDENAVVGPLTNLLKNGWSFAKTIGSLGMAAPEVGSMEDDAGSAIFLGSLIGGGMSLASNYMEQKQTEAYNRKQAQMWDDYKKYHKAVKHLLVDDYKSPYKTFTTADKDGNVVETLTSDEFKDGALDPEKFAAMAFRHKMDAQFFGEALLAEEKLDENHTKFNADMALLAYA